jgi:hypothetical protein
VRTIQNHSVANALKSPGPIDVCKTVGHGSRGNADSGLCNRNFSDRSIHLLMGARQSDERFRERSIREGDRS